jgi:hypothetical protein
LRIRRSRCTSVLVSMALVLWRRGDAAAKLQRPSPLSDAKELCHVVGICRATCSPARRLRVAGRGTPSPGFCFRIVQPKSDEGPKPCPRPRRSRRSPAESWQWVQGDAPKFDDAGRSREHWRARMMGNRCGGAHCLVAYLLDRQPSPFFVFRRRAGLQVARQIPTTWHSCFA